jgi:uncharacterized protein (DUF488 family)
MGDVTEPKAKARPVVWTVGHSTRAIEDLLDLLRSCEATVLVDVRTVPRSRHNPQFNRETLPTALAASGFAYLHVPALGGLRRPRPDSTNTAWRNASFRGYADHMETEEFRVQLDAIEALAIEGRPVLMCAEAVPWRCHRSLIADALLARGIEVQHLLTRGREDPHKMTPFAKVEDGRVTYPALV